MTIGIIILVLVMTWMGTIASLFFKRATASEGIFGLIKDLNLWIGGGIYAASAVINIIVLRYLDYSVVLPLTSLTYVWTMIVSYLLLKEKISRKKIIGVTLIVAGAVCVAI